MHANPYTGEVQIEIAKKKRTIVFDFHALSALHSQFADEMRGGYIDVMKINDPVKLAGVLAIGLKEKHPDMTAEAIMEARPPLAFVKAQLDKALAYAYFGADIVQEVVKVSKAAEKLVQAVADPSKKKSKK